MPDINEQFRELPQACPVQNICRIADEQAPICGRAPDHYPPLVLAEELCPQAILGVIAYEQKRMPPRQQSTRAGWDFRMGSLYFDLAITQRATPVMAEEYMLTATKHLDAAASRDDLLYSVSATFLRACIPFAPSRDIRPLPPYRIPGLQRSIIDAADRTTGGRFRDVALQNAGLKLLYARTGGVLFTATARETTYARNAAVPNDDPVHHSGYLLDYTNRDRNDLPGKVPHRLHRYIKQTDLRRVMYMSLDRMARFAFHKVAGKDLEPGSAIEPAFDLLYGEASGYDIGHEATLILDEINRHADIEKEKFRCRKQQSRLQRPRRKQRRHQ